MKCFKFLAVVLLAALLLAAPVFGAGTVTLSDTRIKNAGSQIWEYYIITATCTGDASDGSFPATTVTADSTGLRFGGPIGWALYMVHSDPGTTSPTANSDLTITDEATATDSGASDILDGNGANLIQATTSEVTYPAVSGQQAEYPIDTDITLNISGNSVNSAQVVLKLYFKRP